MPGILIQHHAVDSDFQSQVHGARGKLTRCLALIPVLRQYLQAHRGGKVRKGTITIMHHCLLGVQYALEVSKTHPGIISSLMHDWPTIWKWCSFLVNQHVDGKNKASHYTATITMILLSNSDHHNHRRILETPGFISTICRIWVASSVTRVVREELSITLSHIVAFLEDRGDACNVLHSIPELPKAILDRLVAASRSRPLNLHLIVGPLQLLVLCTRTSPTMHRAALAHNSISIIVNLMAKLTSRTTVFQNAPKSSIPYPFYPSEFPRRQAKDLQLSLETCASYLERCMSEDGFGWAADALDAPEQLLPAVLSTVGLKMLQGKPKADLTSHPASLPESLCDVYLRLLGCIATHGESLQVLFRIAEAIVAVEDSGLEEDCFGNGNHSLPTSKDPFTMAWYAFKLRNRELLGAMDLYALQPRRVCCNPQCTTPEVKASETKFCSRCLLTVYCSAACHTQHEELHGHSQHCSDYVAELEAGYPRFMSRADEDFQVFLRERRPGYGIL